MEKMNAGKANSNKPSATTEYDESGFYDKEIRPLIDDVRQKCVTHKIPFLMSFAVKNSDADGTEYVNEGMSARSHGISIKDDTFGMTLLAINGGTFIPPEIAREQEDAEVQAYFNGDVIADLLNTPEN